MNKPVFGLLLGGILGIFDGLSALVSAPETAPQIVGIVIGSTIKGLLAGVVIGLFARKVKSVPLTILFGLAVGATLAFWVAYMQGKYYLEIMLPGSVLGVVVGYATQKFGERRAQAAALLLPLLLVAPPLRAGETPAAGKVDGRAAFETLKTLAGEWNGNTLTEDGAPGATRFRVTAGGHAVEEVMFPGTNHEMVNMYHLAGDELVVTHYCSSGNRPEMKLDPGASKPGDLVFAFSGGVDPARDTHIHGARLVIEEGGLREEWSSWSEGKEAGVMKFFLKRAGA